jgi:branched-chain amino acid transport system ATP-binding protein
LPALLEVRDLSIRFGGIAALSDVSFDVAEGHVSGLIGPNGAGKTTCFNCITRLYQPSSGKIAFAGSDLLRFAPHQLAAKRIVRTFQNVALFDRLSTLDNVLVGCDASAESGAARGRAAVRGEALQALKYLDLLGIAERPVRGLPFGTRKMVELARALAARPRLLLLDEPASGLTTGEVGALTDVIRAIARDYAATIVMVEHHMQLVMSVSDHVIVLASGRKIADGTPEAVQRDRGVIEAYLGTS